MITKEPSLSTNYKTHPPLFQGGGMMVVQIGFQLVILGAIALLAFGIAWNFSTRRYLKGFADAIIPLEGSPKEKTEALADWFRHEPQRNNFPTSGSAGLLHDRDPVNIVQNARLLKVCGTASNAFMNLADASGLAVRRLLLLDTSGNTMHVVAEVQWGSKWIVVDPSHGIVFRDHLGRALAKEELRNPELFHDAISRIPTYDPKYTFDRTIHIHLERIPILGRGLRRLLDRLVPGWEESVNWSYLLENPALWIAIISLPLLLIGVLGKLMANRKARLQRDAYLKKSLY
jgi:hypothetical protein